MSIVITPGYTGKVLQVVAATYSTLVGPVTSASGVTTGLTATITPKSTNSKVLALFTVCIQSTAADTPAGVYLDRGGSNIFQPAQVLTAQAANTRLVLSGNYLDSPASVSALTYTVYFYRQGGTGSVYAQGDSSTSSIVLLEIGI